MAFYDNKSAGDIIKSQDWDDFVAYAQQISSNSYGFSSNASNLFAPISKGVTNGDSHDHSGGDGAQIDHTTLSNIGSYTHSQIDTHIDNATSDYYSSSLAVGLSGSYSTHRQDTSIHYTKSTLDDDYAGSSNYSTHKNDSTIHFTKESLDDDYAGSSNVNWTKITAISSGFDGRLDTLESQDIFDQTLYITSANALSTFADSSNYSTHKSNASAHHAAFIESDLTGDVTSSSPISVSNGTNRIKAGSAINISISNYIGSTQAISRFSDSSNVNIRITGVSSNLKILDDWYESSSNKYSRAFASAQLAIYDSTTGGITGWQALTASDGSIAGLTGTYAISGTDAPSISVPGYSTISSQAQKAYASAQIALYDSTTGGITGWYDLDTGTGITPFGGSVSISGTQAESLSVLGYNTISSQAKKAYASAQLLKDPAFATWGRTSTTIPSGSHVHPLSSLSDITLREEFGTNRWKSSGLQWNTSGYWEPGKMAGGGGAIDNYTVKIDAGSDDDYIGAAGSDGVLRVNDTLDYTDGGDFITLNVNQKISGGAVSGSEALNWLNQSGSKYNDSYSWYNASASTISESISLIGESGQEYTEAYNWFVASSQKLTIISGSLSSRISTIEGYDEFDHELYITSSNALNIFAGSSNINRSYVDTISSNIVSKIVSDTPVNWGTLTEGTGIAPLIGVGISGSGDNDITVLGYDTISSQAKQGFDFSSSSDLFDHELYLQSSSKWTDLTDGGETNLHTHAGMTTDVAWSGASEFYAFSSNVKEDITSLFAASTSLDSRIDTLEGYDEFNSELYITSTSAISRFADSSSIQGKFILSNSYNASGAFYPSALGAALMAFSSNASNLYAPIDGSGSSWSGSVGYIGHSSNSSIHHQYASSMTLGTPDDGSLSDGCCSWTVSTRVTNALDEVNEILNELAPSDADSLSGKTLVDNITLHSGRLASGANIVYKTGEGPTASVSYITDDNSIILDAGTPGITFNKADEGTLRCYVNSVESGSINLASKFNESERNESQSYPPLTSGSVTVLSVGKYNAFQKWQVGSGQISITPATQFNLGYNEVYMSHEGLSSDVSSNNYECWYDPNSVTNVQIIGTPKITENTKKSKYLSGVENYYQGSTFDVTCSSQHCFWSAYRSDERIFRLQSMTGHSAENINVGHGDVEGVSEYPVTGETATLKDHTITLGNYSTRSSDARVTCVAYNAYDNGSTASASEDRLVDTYKSGSDGTSSDVYEYFDDEWYRLPSGAYDSIPANTTNVWRSENILGVNSGQVYAGRLYFPTVDFSSHLPAGNPDYSSGFSNVEYYRAFIDSGTPHTNGQLELGNLTNSDVDPVGTGDVNVEIKLPGLTGWLDLGTDYDSGSFSGADGDGCKTAQSGDDWSWTSGTNSTADSGYMIIVRVTIRNSSKSITQIRELGW